MGYICPDCQTPQEDLDAELRFITGDGMKGGEVRPDNTPEFREWMVRQLIDTYPTPEIMRHKATQLEAANKDHNAQVTVGLMRAIADAMESGELWETDWNTP